MPTLLAIVLLAATTPQPGLQPRDRAPLETPAPASLDREAVLAWMAAYVKGENWTMLAWDREGVKLTVPGGVRRAADGLAEADVRTELFRPIEVSAGVARSGLARWRIDCAAEKLAVVRMTIFAGNNLEGEVATHLGDAHAWQDPVGSEGDAIRAVCSAVGR
jgi:hypothetical protein